MKTPFKELFEDNRGFALIVTIMIFSLIVPLTLQFNTATIFYKVSAANLEDGAKAGCVAKSGIAYALAVLYADASSTEFDSLQEEWAKPETLNGDAASLFKDEKLEIIISDNSAKLNINRLILQDQDKAETSFQFDDLMKPVFKRLLESLQYELEEDEIGNILNSIKDWIDPDDEVTEEEGFGAENSYYQSLSEPYACRNGPLKSLDELRLVKGITKEIYAEISKYLTIYGEGKININTTSKKVLESLHDEIDEGIANDIIEYRDEEKNDLSAGNWYKNVKGIGDVNIDNLITVSSSYFEVISTGFKGSMGKKIFAMVERKKGEAPRFISWRIE